MKFIISFVTTMLGMLAASPVFADQPRPWQYKFQEAASPVMEQFIAFHNHLLWMVFGVSIFVVLLLLYVCIRFRAKRNPNPSTTTHHTFLEIIWTVVPIIILIAIAIPSLKSLYFADEVPKADMTLKVVGYQWYWGYEYPDHGKISFLSNLVPDEEIKGSQVRLLSVDNPVVLPVNTNIRIQLTAADVIHAWAVPALGVKRDAVPGRLNETWVNIKKPGTYYGQCSELCGQLHGFMPIEIRAVSKAQFAKWVKRQKEKQ